MSMSRFTEPEVTLTSWRVREMPLHERRALYRPASDVSRGPFRPLSPMESSALHTGSQSHRSFYCTHYMGACKRPATWHDVRHKSPTTRLRPSTPPRALPPLPPRCTVTRPPPDPTPLLERTTNLWSPGGPPDTPQTSPRGMRFALRHTVAPGEQMLRYTLKELVASPPVRRKLAPQMVLAAE